MLEKLFKKDSKETNFNILILVGIVIAILFLSATSGMDNINNNVETEEVNIKELLSNITDNYTVKIKFASNLIPNINEDLQMKIYSEQYVKE